MAKTLFEQNGGTYTKQAITFCRISNFRRQPEYEIGVWGQRRRRYLKEYHRVLYYNMLTQNSRHKICLTGLWTSFPKRKVQRYV